jgi:hypothetical protein
MSKHKKRVSLAQQPSGQFSPPPQRPAEPKQTSRAPEPAPEDDGAEYVAETADPDYEDAAPARRGIETQPIFWFVLGALTVGIVVLLGLLLMGSGSASPAPTGKPATKPPATVAVQAGRTELPDILATITAAVQDNQSVPRIGIEEARRKHDAGQAIIVDVRSKEAYAEMHIKGSINIPEPDTIARLSEFPKDKDIILYCG